MGTGIALLAWALAPMAAADPPVLAGEAVKVDLVQRLLVVRPAQATREAVFEVDAARTRIGLGGRAVSLEAVRPGEWVLVAYEPAPARSRAVQVKVGAARPAAAARR